MNPRKQEIKDIILRIINEQSGNPVRDFSTLKQRVIEYLHPQSEGAKASAALKASVLGSEPNEPQLSEEEWALFSEIYWDLVLDRVITPGLNSQNREFDRFRIHSEHSPRRQGSA